jgi:hypothetical protein
LSSDVLNALKRLGSHGEVIISPQICATDSKLSLASGHGMHENITKKTAAIRNVMTNAETVRPES